MEKDGIKQEDNIIKHPQEISYVKIDVLNENYFNSNYIPILVAIDLGKQTFNEIYEFYPPETVRKRINCEMHLYYHDYEKMLFESSQEEKKSEITIKRYINKLINVNLVTEIGQRINYSSNLLKKLYGLTASIHVPINRDEEFLQEKKVLNVIKIINQIVKKQFNSSEDLSSKINDYFNYLDESKRELIENYLRSFIINKKNTKESIKTIREIKTLGSIGYSSFFYFLGLLFHIIYSDNWIKKIVDFKLKRSSFDISKNKLDVFKSEIRIDSEDIVLKQYPEIVKFIGYDKWISFFQNPKYRTIFKVLKVSPLTIQDLRSKLKDSHEKNEIKRNTLYKKLVELKKAGFIIEAGRLIDKDKNYTSILFSRSAYIYFLDYNITGDMWRNFTRVIGKMISYSLERNFNSQTEEKFHKFFMKFFNNYLQNPIEILERYSTKEIIESILGLDEISLFLFIRFISIIELFLGPEDPLSIKKELLDCF
ncbi:MAG: hypothetical protein ACW981_00125 [Candidatus Hodarchaeales archaeon]